MRRSIMSAGRWKQIRGRVQKAWGRLKHDPCEEFLGEWDIMEGKIEEYKASKDRDAHQARRPRASQGVILLQATR